MLEQSSVQDLGVRLDSPQSVDLDAAPKPRNPKYKGAKRGHRGWGTVRKLPSGKYQASYVGRDNMRHKADGTFDSKMNAEGWLANESAYMERCRMTGEAWKSPAQRAEDRKQRFCCFATTASSGSNSDH